MLKKFSLMALLSCTVFVPFTAQAEPYSEPSADPEAPAAHGRNWFSADVVMELQTEQNIDSDNEEFEDNNNTFWRTEFGPTVRLNDHFYIDGNAVLEPVRDADLTEDNFFQDEGVFIEELKLNYENGPWHLFGGKFNPGFGTAWDWGRGIWSEDFAEDYEITEKIGVGGSYAFETPNAGTHTLTLSTFFADTTPLSESAITHRGNNSEDDGGVSNTEDFSSYVAALEGEDVLGVESLYYSLGYRHQAEGDEDVGMDDENGGELTLGYTFPVSERIKIDTLGEYAHISNFEGGPDDRDYYSVSAITKIDDKWNVTVGYTKRAINVDGGDNVDDHLFQLSAGYDFGNGLTLEGGWKNTEEDDEDNNIIGGLARYQFSF